MGVKIRMMNDREMESVTGGAYNGTVFLYPVQEGDSLSVLAHRFGTTVAVLAELNHIEKLDSVYPGVKLLVPLKG